MIDRRRLFAALTLPVLALAAPGLPGFADDAETETGGSVELVDGFARATPPSAMAGVAYGTLRSLGPADRLVGLSSPAAARVMIHDNVETDGVMQMRPVDALEIPAGGAAVLAPGGLHIMLMGLTAPLVAGEDVEITLDFETAGSLVATLPVQPLSAQ